MAMIGLPPFSGFLGKVFILQAAVGLVAMPSGFGRSFLSLVWLRSLPCLVPELHCSGEPRVLLFQKLRRR